MNQAVARVLRVKFMLGLFDHPFVDEKLDATVRHSQAQTDLALESARQSMCLLKNEGGLLPLKKDIKHIAVIGPNANIARIGRLYRGRDTKVPSKECSNKSSNWFHTNSEVSFSDGEDIGKAVALAKNADVVILGLGEWHENFRRRF